MTLFLMTLPLSSSLFLNTHLVPIVVLFWRQGNIFQTWLFFKLRQLFYHVFYPIYIFNASLMFFSSIWEIIDMLFKLSLKNCLVLIWSNVPPIICYWGWYVTFFHPFEGGGTCYSNFSLSSGVILVLVTCHL